MNPKGHKPTLQARQPGNSNAQKHGIYSERALDPRAEEIRDAYLATPQADPIDQVAAEEIDAGCSSRCSRQSTATLPSAAWSTRRAMRAPCSRCAFASPAGSSAGCVSSGRPQRAASSGSSASPAPRASRRPFEPRWPRACGWSIGLPRAAISRHPAMAMDQEVDATLGLLASLVLENGVRWGVAATPWQWQDGRAICDPNTATPYHYLTRPRSTSKTTDLAAIVLAQLIAQAPPGACPSRTRSRP